MDELLSVRSAITHEIDFVEEETEGEKVIIGGIIERTRRIFTKKNGNEMAFITLGNEKGILIECVVFPKVFTSYKHLLNKDTVVIIEGKIDINNDKSVIIAEKISQARSYNPS
ncbi:MAG: hypothetical protein HYU48_01650 [Candidatus Levybacteria bacterium]|nr:hypothetical protein [Candidatus Levybacteria bacterium]